MMPKQRLTLYINENLVEPMKVIAVMEKHNLSDLTEVLYQEYLEKHKEFVRIIERGKQKL
jgi:hypothetical protein